MIKETAKPANNADSNNITISPNNINTHIPTKRQKTIQREDAIYLLSEQGYTDDEIANVLESERTWVNKQKKAAQRRWNPIKVIDRKFGNLVRKRAHNILKEGSDSAAASLINRYLDQMQPKTNLSVQKTETTVKHLHKIDISEYQDVILVDKPPETCENVIIEGKIEGE